MSEVIYRKYRARKFSEIYGQQVVVQVLLQSIKGRKTAHAYLFAGPRGTGKTSMARLVAKAVNCEKLTDTGDVCNECANCISFDSGTYMDLIEIDAASNRGIEEIRQLKDNLNYLPTQGSFKVYIIDEVHMLTREAFNALLKTLEEPPGHIIFILATTEVHKVPATILSRVQRFDFRLATEEELVSKLQYIAENEHLTVEPAVLSLIYDHAGGSFRDAESLLGKVITDKTAGAELTLSQVEHILGVAPREIVVALCSHILEGDKVAALDLLDQTRSQGVSLVQVLKQIISYLQRQIAQVLREGSNYSGLLQLLSLCIEGQNNLRFMDDVRLVLEMIIWKSNGDSRPSVSKKQGPSTGLPSPIAPEPAPIEQQEPISDEPDEETTAESSWDRMSQAAKKKSFKLWTLFRGVTPNFRDQVLTLESRYKYNVETLKSADLFPSVQELATTFFGNGVKLEIRLLGKETVGTEDEQIPDVSSSPEVDSNEALVEGLL